jgi:molybdopterin converting factor small subunit
MQIHVEYAAQLKRAAGTGRETVELNASATLSDLIRLVAERHGDVLKPVLLDGNGNLHPSILVFVNDEQCRDAAGRELNDRDTVAFLSPISGG